MYRVYPDEDRLYVYEVDIVLQYSHVYPVLFENIKKELCAVAGDRDPYESRGSAERSLRGSLGGTFAGGAENF